MQINVVGKNVNVTPALREYTEKKLSKLEKYIRQDAGLCQVIFTSQRGRYVVEVTLPLNGMILRAEESAQDAFASVDLVVEKLERQVEKYKTRLLKRDKSEPKAVERMESGEEPETGKIVKIKKFDMKPMLPEEALLQMELLGHDFFVFTNGETGLINVIYRRKDGNFGLIEPEI
ncbi:MAG TPA: ribosome-associated translation inhibitor RaiA [Bacillota bacterium]|nr:ribosome-associated translation inhibitor RaiA [Candidatus Fermentithermobacillaceae bacterium]HOB30284.1 ribosome-associated translation inhibitor RaiA [Bacillota bacterium]HOK64107.1 ribosome-associated translation inhibitor RaiA [Bacillota bacterium]HOL11616.1 ribosome-associated translation inhibitor RaiA [Bacillota bacterium]HOQ02744.1 ribosome-associated translation inhibitor RaiA [Bacillota bacterium]